MGKSNLIEIFALLSPCFLVGFGIGGLALYDQNPVSLHLVILTMGVVLLTFNLGWHLLTGPISLPDLSLMPGELKIEQRNPSMKPPILGILLSLPFFLIASVTSDHLSEDPSWQYVLPIGSLLVGFCLYVVSISGYWLNQYTVYYVTTLRVARVNTFMHLGVREIPIESINSISEEASFAERGTRRGRVVVASGVGPRHTLRIQAIDDPGPVARAIRQIRYRTEQ